VSYLVDEVLTSRPARQPLKDVLLPTLAATNISVKEYRSKVASYLDSSAFKQRWDALRQQVCVCVCVRVCVCACVCACVRACMCVLHVGVWCTVAACSGQQLHAAHRHSACPHLHPPPP
jgi:hypothetical protein